MRESGRIKFVINRDGIAEAKMWALRTLRIYRAAVLKNGKDGSRPHHASYREYRRGFIESYLCLKSFCKESCDKRQCPVCGGDKSYLTQSGTELSVEHTCKHCNGAGEVSEELHEKLTKPIVDLRFS